MYMSDGVPDDDDRVVNAGANQTDAERPLVVTLGWLGANKRHLGKYSSWYSSRGFDTLSFISPASAMYVRGMRACVIKQRGM